MPYLLIGRPRGPVATTQPPGATVVNPGDSISAAITTAGSGGTLYFKAGTHKPAAAVTPLANQTLLGELGATIDGSVVISGPWTQDGAAWWAAAQLPATANTTGVCTGAGTQCQPAEDVYRDNGPLTRVMTQAAVTGGTYFGDYPNNRIYVGDDPNGHLIEQAKIAYFISAGTGTAGGVRLANLTIRRFACEYQKAAVTCNGTGWTVENCDFNLSHTSGVQCFGDNPTIRDNRLSRNGCMGLDGFGFTGGLVENNEADGNNYNDYDQSWEAGGAKLSTIHRVVFRGNQFNGNLANGLWIDIDSTDVTIDGNIISRNAHHGVHYEISYSGQITRNCCSYNTDKGIDVNTSSGVQVSGNDLVGNGWDLWLIADDQRGSGGQGVRELANVSVHHNTVRHSSTQAGRYAAGIDLVNTAGTIYLTGKGNLFDWDVYTVSGSSDTRFFYDAAVTGATWQADGEDVNGTFLVG